MQARTTETGDKPNPVDMTGLCLLSLDGGGVRGLSTLFVLRSVMKKLNHKRCEAQLPPVKPCEVFDLIGGTSTGGLIAIMLGRLGMDVDECIEAYVELIKTIFEQKLNSLPVGGTGKIKSRFDSGKLKDAIMAVAARHGASGAELFNNGQERGTKVFVCATAKETSGVTRLRSYSLDDEPDIQATICEAALATSAATGFFDPVSVGARYFVDGALGANNPVDEVEGEASVIWCPDTGNLKPLVKCFISIGTGSPGKRVIEDNVFKFFSTTLVGISTETEETERKFIARWAEHFDKKRFFRFNVEQGLQNVGLDEYRERGRIEAATHEYLGHQNQKFQVRDCAQNLRQKQYPTKVGFDRLVDEYKVYSITRQTCKDLSKNKDAADYQTDSRAAIPDASPHLMCSSRERHEDFSDGSDDTEYGEEQWRNVCRARKRDYKCLNCGHLRHYEDTCWLACGRCRIKGHKQRECSNYIKCDECGGRNHMAPDCRNQAIWTP